MEELLFLCNSDPHHLVASFIGALENLVSRSRAKMKNLFFDIETTIKIKLGSILEKLTQRHIRREQADLDDCDNEVNSILADTKKSITWSSRVSWMLVQCFTCVWFQRCKIRSQPNQNNCYPFLLTNKKLNLLSERRRTSSSRSKLVIFN